MQNRGQLALDAGGFHSFSNTACSGATTERPGKVVVVLQTNSRDNMPRLGLLKAVQQREERWSKRSDSEVPADAAPSQESRLRIPEMEGARIFPFVKGLRASSRLRAEHEIAQSAVLLFVITVQTREHLTFSFT
jgi:hypothetical protein